MKFRIKITLCMIALLSLLFGVGGSALISISFQSALEREKQAAQESCRFLLGALQATERVKLWRDEQELSNTLKQLTSQGILAKSALRLFSEQETLYTQGEAVSSFQDLSGKRTAGSALISYFTSEDAVPYLQLSNTFQLGDRTFQLDIGYDVSALYDTRIAQQQAYYRVFCVMLVLCAALSYGVAYLLTRPLSALSKASCELAAGHLSYRSNIRSHDELGALSKDFDAMAQQVEQSVSEMKAAKERQDRFMGSFVHELKTPMTSILGYADLLRGGALTAQEQADSAHYIFSESKRLESLSLQLLDIFVADKQKPRLQPVDLSELIGDTVEHLVPIYQMENISIQYRSDRGVCFLEPVLVRTLLLNLLDNARKALEQGGEIIVTSTMLPSGCLLIVQDNGPGIPPEALEHLTEAFYRVDPSRSRVRGSAGLGLTLCEKIAQLHEGSILFESGQERGTKVIVELKGAQLCIE